MTQLTIGDALAQEGMAKATAASAPGLKTKAASPRSSNPSLPRCKGRKTREVLPSSRRPKPTACVERVNRDSIFPSGQCLRSGASLVKSLDAFSH